MSDTEYNHTVFLGYQFNIKATENVHSIKDLYLTNMEMGEIDIVLRPFFALIG